MRLLYAAIGLFLITPAALAHNTVETDDGVYFMTLGHANEPTTTWMKTGLDFTVRENDGGERGDEVPGVQNTLTAVYISPGGEEMEGTLQLQHGAVGRYTFDEPLYLTEPGQYSLRLSGTIENSTVDGTYNVSGPVPAWGEHTFPDVNAATNGELETRIADLEAQVARLQADMTAMQQQMDDMMAMEGGEKENNVPVPGAIAATLALVGAAMLLRRR